MPPPLAAAGGQQGHQQRAVNNSPAWMQSGQQGFQQRRLVDIAQDGSNVGSLKLGDLPPNSMPGILDTIRRGATFYFPRDYCMNGDGTNGRVFTVKCTKPAGACRMHGHPHDTDGSAGQHYMSAQQRAAFLRESGVTQRYV